MVEGEIVRTVSPELVRTEVAELVRTFLVVTLVYNFFLTLLTLVDW